MDCLERNYSKTLVNRILVFQTSGYIEHH